MTLSSLLLHRSSVLRCLTENLQGAGLFWRIDMAHGYFNGCFQGFLMPMHNRSFQWLHLINGASPLPFLPNLFTPHIIIFLPQKPIVWCSCQLSESPALVSDGKKLQKSEAMCSCRGNKLFKSSTLLRTHVGTCCFIFFPVNRNTTFVRRLVFYVLALIVIRILSVFINICCANGNI